MADGGETRGSLEVLGGVYFVGNGLKVFGSTLESWEEPFSWRRERGERRRRS
jgi:hypothetical protein